MLQLMMMVVVVMIMMFWILTMLMMVDDLRQGLSIKVPHVHWLIPDRKISVMRLSAGQKVCESLGRDSKMTIVIDGPSDWLTDHSYIIYVGKSNLF
jgi:hypothetical protein